MNDPLRTIRDRCGNLSDSVRWACILEATAPKAGNVYPGQDFDNLTYAHFISAADISADYLTRFDQPIGDRISNCVHASRSATGTNVNLGIILLIAPLAESIHQSLSMASVLSSLTTEDGQQVFKAIQTAGAGGLDQVDEMDVASPPDNVDLIEAMRLAADRDRIALQYTSDFADLFEHIVPVLAASIDQCGDVITGICDAHLRLLAANPDSLIARKCGLPVAKQVQQHAAGVDRNDPDSVRKLDAWLRSDGNRLNPGTTADLIAAALFVLLTPNT